MSEENSDSKKLIEKLVAASKLITPIAKDGFNSFNKYQFQSESAIKSAVKEAIQKVGISIIPKYEVTNQYDKGKNHYVDVLGTYLITDGVEQYIGTMPGSGQDVSEKAMAKACTTAQKYFYKQLFNITDKDEDPDSEPSREQENHKSQNSVGRQSRQSSRPANQRSSMSASNNDTAKKAAIEAQKKVLIIEAERIAKSMNSDGKTVLSTLFAADNMTYSQKSWNTLTVAQLNHLVGAAKKIGVTDQPDNGGKA